MIRDKKIFYFILLAVIFLILLGVYHDMRTCWGSNDFDTYYFAGNLVRSGENLYTHEVFRTTMGPYLYLPFFALLISPLTFLHIRFASAIWYVFNILVFAGTVYLSVEIAAGKGKFSQIFATRPYLLRIVSVIFPVMVWVDNACLAQVDILVFFLLLLSLFAYEKKRPFLSGVVLAIAGVIKIYPFYFLLYFLAKRRFKAVIGFFAGILLFIFIVPWVGLGQDNFMDSMKSWVAIRVMPYMEMGGQTVGDNFAHYEAQLKPKNQALSAVVTRYSIRDDEDVSRMKKEDFEYEIYWPHPLRPVQVDIVVKTLLLIIFAVTFLNLDYGRRYRDGLYPSLEYSIVFLSMLLLFPMVKSHTLAAVIFPVIAFNCAQSKGGIIGRPMRIIFLLAIVLYVLQVVEYMSVLGTGCFAVLILWLLFLKIIRKERLLRA